VFYRIFIFYILGVFVTGMIVPSNDPHLLKDTGTAAQSPYVIAGQLAGVKVLPHIINAAVFTSAFSAGSSFLFTSSRVLYGLAIRGQAPRIFAYCTSNGLPLVAVIFSAAFSLLAFMNVSDPDSTVLNWLVNITSVAGLLTWMAINLTYLRFHAGLKNQGVDRTKFFYYSSFQPYLAWWGVVWTTFCVLISGAVFSSFSASNFLSSYLPVLIFVALHVGYKVRKRTTIWAPEEMDFFRGIPRIEETEIPEQPPKTFLGKVAAILF